MPEFIVHDLIGYGNFKQWLVITNEDTLRDYVINFGENSLKGITNAIAIYQSNFYEIKRYYQFVGLFKYIHTTKMFTLALFECSNMDEFLEGFSALQGKDWKIEDLTKIGMIAQEIIDDTNKELASIRLNKLL